VRGEAEGVFGGEVGFDGAGFCYGDVRFVVWVVVMRDGRTKGVEVIVG
jgi:hypothetical protein